MATQDWTNTLRHLALAIDALTAAGEENIHGEPLEEIETALHTCWSAVKAVAVNELLEDSSNV